MVKSSEYKWVKTLPETRKSMIFWGQILLNLALIPIKLCERSWNVDTYIQNKENYVCFSNWLKFLLLSETGQIKKSKAILIKYSITYPI